MASELHTEPLAVPGSTLPNERICVQVSQGIVLDVRLHRAGGDGADGLPAPTAAGFRLPLHQAQRVANAIAQVAGRGGQAAPWVAGQR